MLVQVESMVPSITASKREKNESQTLTQQGPKAKRQNTRRILMPAFHASNMTGH